MFAAALAALGGEAYAMVPLNNPGHGVPALSATTFFWLEAGTQRVFCPPEASRPARSVKRHHVRRSAKPSRRAAAKSGRGATRQQRHAMATFYAVQLKSDLTGEQREAAIATLRDKYKLTIVKVIKGLDLLRVSPTPTRTVVPPKSVGEALSPKIIEDLRKEPFVDAAYVDAPLTPQSMPRGPARKGP
jgi:hypothetical protein